MPYEVLRKKVRFFSLRRFILRLAYSEKKEMKNIQCNLFGIYDREKMLSYVPFLTTN
uniref:Uncharacterized protein n=1 Tax=Anguilla anguilla TaxID=7936 RepID=A0A0E9P6V1_ANGAN